MSTSSNRDSAADVPLRDDASAAARVAGAAIAPGAYWLRPDVLEATAHAEACRMIQAQARREAAGFGATEPFKHQHGCVASAPFSREESP